MATAPFAAPGAGATTTTTTTTTTTLNGTTANAIRQSARQTRTNPSRISKSTNRSSFTGLVPYGFGAAAGAELSSSGAAAHNGPHGLYPAITHFTDAITALPKEFRRHASLLKEVDGKAWALEEALGKQLDAATASTPYAKLMQGGLVPTKEPINYESPESVARRKIFFELRSTLSDLMITTDEKNHVLWNANNELEKQVRRIEATFPYVEGEISEEARLGSLTHWAYSNKTAAKTTGNTSERPRRETASTRDQNLAAALEGESRREGISRKHRRTHAEADGDEGRVPSRKNTGGKGRSGETPANENISIGGGGALASSAAPAKRRRVDKAQPTATATAMERSVSATTNTGRGASKEVSATDAVKKRIRAPNTNPAGRKRTNTAASAAGSPALVSSPVVPSLNNATKASSPAPNAIPRPQSSRAQQNSTQAVNGRQRPSSSASNRAPNSSTLPGPVPGSTTYLEVSNPVVPPTAEKPTDLKRPFSNPKDSSVTKPEPSSTIAGAHPDERSGLSTTMSRPLEPLPKREDAGPSSSSNNTSGSSTRTEPSLASEPPSTAPQPKGRSSKNSTPVVSTFAESSAQQQQQRTTRPRGGTTATTDGGPAKRSHKKGAGLAAAQQLIAAAAVTEDEDSSRQGDDEEDEGEPRYCYCNQVSFGEMVACDNENCPREWFHLSCVGLSKAPLKSSKWYCNECKDGQRKGKSGNGK
ncbi:hypothetical protein AJ79_00384 [Helicocarpus griseus UAMH5409]|uniref:Chromatin modification-related protein n=1 Tax=Helicocarpus griseus UAMH5409 TaxID=1447875 RepID=A0A2B7YBF5_9EURO|nr:hypothetical protein AJ79_00384 [Helicocarpus griseus UAMH5409]